MGLHPNPIGTLDELRREGIGPAFVGSCAPPSKGVRGCSHYEKCIFRLTKNGGFRDLGPRNIGFYHQTHEGHKRQEFMACFTFMQTLYERMRAGIRDREDGLNGEIIRIVAQEGQLIRPKHTINVNAGTNLAPKWDRRTDPIPVPAFQRPHEQGSTSYDLILENEEKQRQIEDPELAVGPPIKAEDMEYGDEDKLPELDDIPSAVPVAKPKPSGKKNV